MLYIIRCGYSLTSGAMYSGVPQAVLHRDPATSSLEYPKSHILMMGSGWLPSSSTLSSCMHRHYCIVNMFRRKSHLSCGPLMMLPRAICQAWNAS